jgi:hypothetical protein
MTAKILPAVVTAVLLGTTALASAQSRTDWNDPYLRGLTPGSQLAPYAGTVWDGIAPYGSEGMAPYGSAETYGRQYYNFAPNRGPRNR